ncbi:MAG: hypothetical protein HOP08_02045 [Cyclobacteriaceae bacterium]|nr:hypothetical protein [Cyclobacteriaceae bacterium]
MNPGDVIEKMSSTGLIAACHPGNEASILNIIKASYKGGLRVFEMKHHREDRSFYLFKRIQEETKNLHLLCLGAGGVPDAASAEIYLQNGAHFILSPFLNKDMAALCSDHGKLWVPGCASLKEVETAVNMGAQVVKIQTANLLGLSFFKEVNHYFPDLHLIPSGSISDKESELLSWYRADTLCVQITHELFNKESVGLKDWAGIEFRVFSFMQRIKRIRSSMNTFDKSIRTELTFKSINS